MLPRGSVLTSAGNYVNSRSECQDNPMISQGENPMDWMGESLPTDIDRTSAWTRKSTMSRLSKSISDSLKVRKKERFHVKSDLVQPQTTCEGGYFNDINKSTSCLSHSLLGRAGKRASSFISRRRSGIDSAVIRHSSRSIDMDTSGVLHATDPTVDDTHDATTPSKHRRISLTAGSTSALHQDDFEDSRQHSSMWDTPMDLSCSQEINQSGLYRKSYSHRCFHSSRKVSASPCAAPASWKPTRSFASSKQFLNQTIDSFDHGHRRSSLWFRQRNNQIVEAYIQHRRRRLHSSSNHSQTFDLSKHNHNKSFDLSMHGHNQTFDLSKCDSQKTSDLSNCNHNQRSDSTKSSDRRCKVSACTPEFSCSEVTTARCDRLSVTVNPLNQTTAHISGYTSHHMLNMSLPVGENGGNMVAPHKMMTACSVHSIAGANAQNQENVAKAGRVASWAVQFDKLLQDPLAVKVFTEFLEKEFSAENIRFWQMCEQFRSVTNEQQRKVVAKDIYSRHIATRASEPVNVDNTARSYTERFLDTPTAIMFDVAQSQILQLMKQDSYPRFLKSDLYKNMLVEELEGNIHDEPDKTSDNKGGNKQNYGKENSGKRRRSILPWKQSHKSVKATSESEHKKVSKKGKEGNNNQMGGSIPAQGTASTGISTGNKNTNNMANIKKYTGLNIDLSIMRKEVFQQKEVVGAPETQVKFCRVILPDGSTTVVCAKPGQTCRSILSKLCEKRSISISNVDVFLLESEKAIDLNEDISTLGSKEIVIERRILFRLDLPDGKSVGAKAKPNRSIRDVLKPILTKYGYSLENINMNVTSCQEMISMEMPVTKLDSQRVVLTVEPGTAGLQKHKGPLFGLFRTSEKRVVDRKNYQGRGDIFKD